PGVSARAAAVRQARNTDLSPSDASAVAAPFVRDPGDPDRLVIDTPLVGPIVGDGGAFLLRPKADLRPTVARFLAGASSASVDILNGAGIAGLARITADRLTARGFSVAN